MSDDGEEIEVIGSVAELSERSGVQNIPDLHRHYIDKITIPSKKGKGMLKRVEEVGNDIPISSISHLSLFLFLFLSLHAFLIENIF
jgi:hypothetical protein